MLEYCVTQHVSNLHNGIIRTSVSLCQSHRFFSHINCIAICTESSLRLQGGTDSTEGRLEICALEAWRTICDTNFGREDATVACKQLGFSRHSQY